MSVIKTQPVLGNINNFKKMDTTLFPSGMIKTLTRCYEISTTRKRKPRHPFERLLDCNVKNGKDLKTKVLERLMIMMMMMMTMTVMVVTKTTTTFSSDFTLANLASVLKKLKCLYRQLL
jgi:hypothetical protein